MKGEGIWLDIRLYVVMVMDLMAEASTDVCNTNVGLSILIWNHIPMLE